MSGSNALLAAVPRQNYLMAADPVSELWASLPEYGGGNSVRAPALTNPGVNVRPAEFIAGQPVRPGYRNELIQLANLASGFAGTSINAVPVPGIRAFHGSPHRFDRFDMSRIGTGEGAQAYGHGLYFAGNEGTARFYRDALSPQQPLNENLLINGKSLADLLPDAPLIVRKLIAGGIARANGDIGAALDAWQGRGGGLSQMAFDAAQGLRGGKVTMPPRPGHMYEVNLRTSPDRLLDWDAPLSQQPQAVREALGRVPYGDRAMQWSTNNPTASGYRLLEDAASDYGTRAGANTRGYGYGARTVAEDLRASGIDGISYLDAGSRAAGEGSRNYVMFDDKLIDIIRRYGIVPPALWGASQAGDGTQ